MLLVRGLRSVYQRRTFSIFFTDFFLVKVAVSRTQPNGRVLGVDIIPAQPPKGVSTIQGNFLSPEIQAYVREFLRDPDRGRPRPQTPLAPDRGLVNTIVESGSEENQRADISREEPTGSVSANETADLGDGEMDRTVDVVLSDMSAPWGQTTGFWKRSLSDPYRRMMNTSGVSSRDHAGSMVCTSSKRLRSAYLIGMTGSLPGCTTFQLQCLEDWWPLRLQVLPGRGRQSLREAIEGIVPKSPPGEAGIFSHRMPLHMNQCLHGMVFG